MNDLKSKPAIKLDLDLDLDLKSVPDSDLKLEPDKDSDPAFLQLQAEDRRNERRLMWAELMLLVFILSAAVGIMLVLSP